MSQARAPLYETLKKYSLRRITKFHTPGHNYGRGLPGQLKSLAQLDLSPMPAIDSLHEPRSAIKQAQELAAACFGAKNTFFLINGTTGGLQASLLATCGGKRIIVARNVHKSVIAGLALAGAKPLFVQPEYDEKFNIPLNVKPHAIQAVIQQDAEAVLITNPSPFGICSDVKQIAKIVHKYRKILIVDEAWGAHLKFNQALPPSALEMGADIVIQSTHKRLGAFSQASMLHVNSGSLYSKIKEILKTLQTTSPSYFLLASLDLARRQMALRGFKLWDHAVRLAIELRRGLNKLGFECLDQSYLEDKGFNLDPTCITVRAEGFKGLRILNRFNVEPEFVMPDAIVLLVGIGNTRTDKNTIIKAFKKVPKAKTNFVRYPRLNNKLILPPREAMMRRLKKMPFTKTVGKISAEIVCPYPPGIPLLIPGEQISRTTFNYLNYLKRHSEIHAEDSRLKTIRVLV